MSDRADFKNSIRQLRDQVMAPSDQPETAPTTEGMPKSPNKPALIKRSDEVKRLCATKARRSKSEARASD